PRSAPTWTNAARACPPTTSSESSARLWPARVGVSMPPTHCVARSVPGSAKSGCRSPRLRDPVRRPRSASLGPGPPYALGGQPQVLGRLPWFALFFRRPLRLRARLPMVSCSLSVDVTYMDVGRGRRSWGAWHSYDGAGRWLLALDVDVRFHSRTTRRRGVPRTGGYRGADRAGRADHSPDHPGGQNRRSPGGDGDVARAEDRKSTRLNSSHVK